MILFPNAKINIGLNITKKRNDGFHELETLMYPIALTDVLEISIATKHQEQKIIITTSGIKIDSKEEDNLIYKAYQLLNADFNLASVKVHLHKAIPMGAGLGGGSADASFMLKGLNDMFSLNLSNESLEEYASELGSDCAFFIKNKPAYATGRGELLQELDLNMKGLHLLVVIPNEHISTKDAYSQICPKESKNSLVDSLKLPIDKWSNLIKNDFEDSVFNQKPKIELVKNMLNEAGAVYSSLSGSGSAVYGIFKQKPDIKNLLQSDYFTWFTELQ